jgi:hypothetical protein
LAEGGAAGSHPAAIERDWRYLIESQNEAGSWIVNGTKADKKDRPHAMSGFCGSTWALLGLSKTLPSATKKGNRFGSAGFESSGLESPDEEGPCDERVGIYRRSPGRRDGSASSARSASLRRIRDRVGSVCVRASDRRRMRNSFRLGPVQFSRERPSSKEFFERVVF